MKMFRFLSITIAGLMLAMTLTVGLSTTTFQLAYAQDSVAVESVPSSEVAVQPSIVEEAPKLCKDEQGNAKVCEDKDLLQHLLVSMGGLKGASALAIAFVISKFLLLLLLSPIFSNIFPSLLKGGVKLLIALGLNVVVGVLGLMVADVSFGAAIVHSSSLAAFSLLGNQAYKQWLTKKGQS